MSGLYHVAAMCVAVLLFAGASAYNYNVVATSVGEYPVISFLQGGSVYQQNFNPGYMAASEVEVIIAL